MKETVLISCVRKKTRISGKYLNPGIAEEGRRNFKGVELSVAGSRGTAASMPALFYCLFCKQCYMRYFEITIIYILKLSEFKCDLL
jgi:hypothetical protein